MINTASLSFRLFLMVALTLLAALAFASPGSTSAASSLTVTKTADTADGSCDADCSLREAIIAANIAGGGDIILPSGTYTLTIDDSLDENDGVSGDLDINSATNILGSGADTTIIDGGGLNRVFHFRFPASSTIAGVTIRNGHDGFGGGIYIAGGALTLLNSTVSGNSTNTSGNGGGIFSQSNLTIDSSTISGNTATGANGGGIYAFSAGTVSITNSTVSGNTALFGGGGIFSATPVTTTLSNVTVSDNSATTANSGGGIRKDGAGGSVTLKNTIVANSASGGNCSGAITSSGYNIDSGTSCALAGSGDLSSTDPLLVPLALNAPGTTETHALLPNSPAVDAGSPDCPAAADQRNVARPQGAGCDIGAYESDPRGDTDCNGIVEGPDLLDVLSDVGDVGTPAACHANGDVDGDGLITTTDALLIAQYMAGVITTFPSNGN